MRNSVNNINGDACYTSLRAACGEAIHVIEYCNKIICN
jgi:hypothetical protein